MTYHRNPTASTPVYDGAGPGAAGATLSLLGVIGVSQRWVVRLSVVSDVGDQYVEACPSDNTTVAIPASQALRGTGGGRQTGVYSSTLRVFTGPTAAIKWMTSAVSNFKIYLEGWEDATAVDPTCAGAPTAAAQALTGVTWAAPGAFDIVDLSGALGASERMAILEYAWNAGSGNDRSFYVRRNGAVFTPHQSNGYTPRGPSNAQLRFIQPVQVAVDTDTSGKIEHAQWSISSTVDIWVHGYVDDWTPSTQALKSGTPPTAFGDDDIDLSATIPQGGVARLQVTRPNAGGLGTLVSVSFREKGSSRDTSHGGSTAADPRGCDKIVVDAEESQTVDVVASSSGYIEWEAGTDAYDITVSLIGYIDANEPPVCTWTGPGGAGILPGATIQGTTTDPEGAIDLAQTQVTLTHDPLGTPTVYNAIINGVVQAGFTGTCTTAGWSITKDGGMLPGSWTAAASCQDVIGASDSDSGAWTVSWSTPPAVVYVSPDDYASGPSAIRFSITDDYGLTPSTLSVSVIESGHGTTVVWPVIVLGAVDDLWQVETTYSGSIPDRIDVVIRDWPIDLAATYRRIEMVVDITSSTGIAL